MGQKKRSTTFRCYSLVNVEKVTVADFAFQKKKLIFKSGTWAGHLNTILYPEGREFEQTKLQKLICPGVCPWGECWSFELMDALEGGQIRSLRLSSLIDHVLVVTLVLLLFHRRLSNNKIEGLNATTFACFENLKEL